MIRISVLSVRQPWAWLIVNGFKDVENRTWASEYRGPLFIHASSKYDPQQWTEAEKLHRNLPPQVEYGKLIGRVEMTGCFNDYPSRWFFGPYGFVFDVNKTVRIEPIAMKGKLGIFHVVIPGYVEVHDGNGRNRRITVGSVQKEIRGSGTGNSDTRTDQDKR